MTFDALAFARQNIRDLKPYSSAREEFEGTADIYLDANENPFDSVTETLALNRYPDPLQREVKELLSARDGVAQESIFVGNGSDEAIDLLIRIFCEPGEDEIIVCPPTYGMYRVAANVNDVAVKEISLKDPFQVDVPAVRKAITPVTKLVFICSPNNPTGNTIDRDSILVIARDGNSIIVVDEAYAEFSTSRSMIRDIANFPNLVVLRTLSKAYGLAAARLGLAYADETIISLMNKTKPPYNVSGLAQAAAVRALNSATELKRVVDTITTERERLRTALSDLPQVQIVFPSDANFLLVRFINASDLYKYLVARSIIVRDRTREPGCENCLRITIGTPEQNDRLLAAISDFGKKEATV